MFLATSVASIPIAAAQDWNGVFLTHVPAEAVSSGGAESTSATAAGAGSAVVIPPVFRKTTHGIADFTRLDPRMGSPDSFAEFVAETKEAGRPILLTLDLNRAAAGWDSSWVRADMPGYEPCGREPATLCVDGSPDFRTDVGKPVSLPSFLVQEWGPELAEKHQSELDAFFARTKYPRTPRYHVVKWLADWVRAYGFDGFYATGINHVDVGMWEALKQEASFAKADWAAEADGRSTGFWLAGDTTPDAERAAVLRELGFDALAESTQITDLDIVELDSVYAHLSGLREENPAHGIITPVASSLVDVSTVFLPGTLELTASAGLNATAPDANELVRTALEFRARHPAVGAGVHRSMAEEPYTFERAYRKGGLTDVVIVVFGASGRTRINVSSAFPDDSIVRDAVTGRTAFVSFGYVSFTPDDSGLLLLELADI